jgi:hypothetical protein
VLYSGLLFQVNCFVCMYANLLFALKFINFGSNIAWTFMWILNWNCDSKMVGLIGFIHGMLSLMNLFLLLGTKIVGKNSCSAKLWRTFTFVSIVILLICYLLTLLNFFSIGGCLKSNYIILIYQRYGLIELICPILLLIFLRS